MRTGIASFLITLGTFFVLQGANLGVTKLVTGSVSTPEHQPDGRLRPARSDLRLDLQDRLASRVEIIVIWWFLFVALASWMLLRTKIGNWIYAVGGNAGQRPRGRCPGASGSRSASS